MLISYSHGRRTYITLFSNRNNKQNGLGFNVIYREDGILDKSTAGSLMKTLMEKLLNDNAPYKMFYANGDERRRRYRR